MVNGISLETNLEKNPLCNPGHQILTQATRLYTQDEIL